MPKPDQDSAFSLEGMVSTLTVLHLRSADMAAIEAEMRAKVEAMPGFFQDAPVAFDLVELEGQDDDESPPPQSPLELAQLVQVARGLGLSPVGIRNPREARRAEARAAGIGVLRGSARGRRTEDEASGGTQAHAPNADAPSEDRRTPGDRRRDVPEMAPPALTLRQPLRGGQVVYAERADAIALGPVNSGAELIADGNIHVYGALRGRALAGAHGDERARIFCQSLEADLVSIAGTYLRAEELPDEHRRRPVQIWLEEGRLRVAKLGG